MSFFSKKNEDVCLNEIRAASEYVSQTFNAPMNLHRLQTQIDKLVETKIDDYFHQRFRDWTVADLIMLSGVVGKTLEMDKGEKRAKRSKVDQNSQVIE